MTPKRPSDPNQLSKSIIDIATNAPFELALDEDARIVGRGPKSRASLTLAEAAGFARRLFCVCTGLAGLWRV